MSSSTRPDLIFLGDSHTIALKKGADALGLRSEILNFSGGLWHEGKFSFGVSGRGFSFFDHPRLNGELERMREELGAEDIFSSKVPVVTTVGYHMGRIVPPMGRNGHKVTGTSEVVGHDEDTVSRAFARDFVMKHRTRHFRFIRWVSRLTQVVMVAPPPIFAVANDLAVREVISHQAKKIGLDVYDGAEDFAADGRSMDARWIAEDGKHGNAAYGAEVLQHLIKRGSLSIELSDKTPAKVKKPKRPGPGSLAKAKASGKVKAQAQKG